MKPITVFTPSYNRAGLLPRCYNSLKHQTCKDFIWMIIDDGSSDGTGELVREWQDTEKEFTIEYYYKTNGGLHTAYNEAIAHINTPLCMCIDSDDWLPEYAIEKVIDFWKANGDETVAGIVGLDCYENGEIIGDPLPDVDRINLIDLLVGKYSIRNGDRTNVVRTELYRKVAPMRSFPGEKFFNPHYMHLLISLEYDFLVLNEPLRFVEYQAGGMSDNIFKQYLNSPNSFAETRRLYLSFPDAPFKFRLRNSIHYVSSLLLSKRLCEEISRSDDKLMLILVIPFGVLLAGYTAYKGKRHDKSTISHS